MGLPRSRLFKITHCLLLNIFHETLAAGGLELIRRYVAVTIDVKGHIVGSVLLGLSPTSLWGRIE